ncbi:MAG: hypothetical protein NTY74_13655 [Ignavibacteriae bacterium]|nr:hypothetical protein [Ignavibacteriota bacterium]
MGQSNTPNRSNVSKYFDILLKEKNLTEKGKLLKNLFSSPQLMNKLFENTKKYFDGMVFQGFHCSHFDIISVTVLKLLTGSRKWNTVKFPNAYFQVLHVFKSEISNHNSSLKNKLTDNKGLENGGTISSDDIDSYSSSLEKMQFCEESIYSKNLLEIFNKHDQSIHELVDYCESQLEEAGKIEELEVFKLWRLGDKNQKMAKELNISVKEVSNRKRRILYFFDAIPDLKKRWLSIK